VLFRSRYHVALGTIAADKKVGKTVDREPVAADFARRRALMLPPSAQYDEIEAAVRRKLVETGAVDVMIDVRGNFFYAHRALPVVVLHPRQGARREAPRSDPDARRTQHLPQGLTLGL